MKTKQEPVEAKAKRAEDELPHISAVATPKLSEITIRQGFAAVVPLWLPNRSSLVIHTRMEGAHFEALRFLVLEHEYDDRPEMEWTKPIQRGTVLHMNEGFLMTAIRCDLTDYADLLGEEMARGSSTQPGVNDVLIISPSEAVAFDQRPVPHEEIQSTSKATQMMAMGRTNAVRQMELMHEQYDRAGH